MMIDAIGNGYEEFRAMIYGEHPGRYWSGLPEKAHFMAIGHFSSHDWFLAHCKSRAILFLFSFIF
jgi:hypothetical protein